MPHLVNGIGTWYLGRRNADHRRDACRSCGRVGDLASYDTRSWFLFVYVPLIPLGRKRVTDECPHCRSHQVAPLDRWREARDAQVGAALQSLRASPWDPAAIMRALHVADAFGDRAALAEIETAAGNLHDADRDVQVGLGNALEGSGRFEDAAGRYRRALALGDDPGIRILLARCLLRLARPADAAAVLEGAGDGVDAGTLVFLAEAWQAQGRHAEALAALDRAAIADPSLVRDEAVTKMRRASEKHRATGKPLRTGAAGWGAPVRRHGTPAWQWVTLALIALLGVGGLAAVAVEESGSRTVHLLNGLPVPYEVDVNGRTVLLHPDAVTETTVPEGPVRVQAVPGSLQVEPVDLTIETPLWSRPFRDPAWVVNPDRAGAFMHVEKIYVPEGRVAGPEDADVVTVHVGAVTSFDHVEHPFEDAPESISMSSSAERARRRALAEIAETPLTSLYGLVATRVGPEEALGIVRARAVLLPDDVDSLALLGALEVSAGRVEEVLAFLRDGLDAEPLPVDRHRAYQQVMRGVGRESELVDEYERRLAASPEDPRLVYLLARVLPDRARSNALLERAASAGDTKDHAWAQASLAYRDACEARFEQAAAWSDRSWTHRKRDTASAAVRVAIMSAVGRHRDALDAVLVLRAESPHDDETAAADLRARLATDQPDDARMIAAQHAADERVFGEAAATWTRTQLEAERAYVAEGDTSAWADVARTDLHREWLAQAPWALLRSDGCAGRLDHLVEVAESDASPFSTWDHVVIGLLADLEGRADVRDAHLALAAEVLAHGDPDDRAAAALLVATEPPDFETLRTLHVVPHDKRVLAVLLGRRFPSIREACFEHAAKLDVDRGFPHHLIVRALGATQPQEG